MNEEYALGKILLIDKPLNWTSFDVVNYIRRIIKTKVGHAGTLDPLATGLLILCTGKFTKQIESLQLQYKVYEGVFTVGATTPSFDRETEITSVFPTSHITDDMISEQAKSFRGEIQQIPPMFSAKKVNGERVYELARQGKSIELKANTVHLYEFEITNVLRKADNTIDIAFITKCSKGTYIRSLARDFGLALNSGAYLTSLRRIRIGDFSVNESYTMEQIKSGVLNLTK